MQDLHIHLSGSTSPVLLFEMINEAGLKMKGKTYQDFEKTIVMTGENVQDLDDYLNILHLIDDVQSSPRAVELSVYNSYVSSFLNGVKYMELRWNPYKRSQNFKIDLDRLIIAGRAGYEKAKSIFKIDGGMILCLGRDVSEAANEAIFKKAIQYHEKGVIGIDVAGPEKNKLDKEALEHYYKTANALDMITTIHVGEIDYNGVEDELAEVLEICKPKRIGHGIQIHRFPKLMKKAAKMGVIFEICITSNLITKVVKSKEEYAKIFKIFEEYGINYCINTDASFALNTNITKENNLYNEIIELGKKQ